MATSKKSTTPKKTKDSNKPSSKAAPPKKTQESKKQITKKTNKNKISNGNVGHSDEILEVPVTSSDSESESEEVLAVPSSSSDSERAPEQNGRKITKTPTPKSKKGTPKRKQKEEPEEEEEVKSYTFPMERVKRIMKCGGSDLNISYDAVFLVNKATERFLEKFAEDSCAACVKDRKKSLAYKHLATVVSKRKRYDFLSDYVPEKIKAEDALAKRKLTEAKAE